MKKIAVLLWATLLFGCSSDEEAREENEKEQWTMVFQETIRDDITHPVDRTEVFFFEHGKLKKHTVSQQYEEETIAHEVILTHTDRQVTVTTEGEKMVYALNEQGYADRCEYTTLSEQRTYQFAYSTEGHLNGIFEYKKGGLNSSVSFTYENGDIASVSPSMNGMTNTFVYEPGEKRSTAYPLPCLALLEIHPLTLHTEALYAGLLGKAPEHFTARTSPWGNDTEYTTYTYQFDEKGQPSGMSCRTVYGGQLYTDYPLSRNISIAIE